MRPLTLLALILLTLLMLPGRPTRADAPPTESIVALGTTYTQNFNALATTGSPAWTNDVTLNGWYSTRTSYTAGTGSSATGALYSFGATSATDRALGSVASGSTGAIAYGLRLRNSGASPITSLTVSYTGEQWRNGGNSAAQRLDFAYQTGASVSSLTTGTWTDVNTLDFTGPIATATAGVLDGNLAANRLARSAVIAVTIAPNSEIMLRWQDVDDAGNDHGLAIDDISVTSTGGTTPTATATATRTPTPTATATATPAPACSTIPQIQGTGNASPCLGARSNIEGCITGVGAAGFYYQAVSGDGNPATSDGLYVYRGSTWTNPSNWKIGDRVRVTGTIVEYYDTTEFQSGNTVTLVGSCTVPAPVSIAPITDPTANLMSLYERYEGMRVQMSFNGWVVGPTKRYDSRFPVDDPEIAFVDFGSTIADYSRVFEFDYAGYQGINFLSGALNVELPDLDVGDQIAATNLTGVLDYNFEKYSLLLDAVQGLTTVDRADVPSNEPALNPALHEFDVCFFNVENLFDHLNDGVGDWGDWAPGYPTSGSAAGQAAYQAKLAKVADVMVSELRGCMVIGVEEVEGKQQVYNDLAAAVASRDGAHTWSAAFVPSGDPRQITQGFLWRNDVALIGSVLPVSGATYSGRVADGVLDFTRTPPTAQFRVHAGSTYQTSFHVYALHFKSKRSSADCVDPTCTDKREKEAADLRDLLAYHQANGQYAIAGGDLNDTFGSTPIAILDNSASVYSLYYNLPAAERWSYIHSGESEVLDHFYITTNLRPATSGWTQSFSPVHIDADFPSREHASDHDPLRTRFSKP